MDTCGSRTVDYGALLADGLLRLPTAAARPATTAHTGCSGARISRGYADLVDGAGAGFVSIDGTSATVAHDERDVVVFLPLSR